MIVVLADDLSGAAEIAGVAQSHGLSVELSGSSEWHGQSDVVVIDTNSRSSTPPSAAETLRRIGTVIATRNVSWVFKKIDSVLRGPVLAEVDALRDTLQIKRTLLVAGNPSQHRLIRGGLLWVDGRPIDQTFFADDPEHPATDADVMTILGANMRSDVHLVSSLQTLPPSGVCIAQFDSLDDLDRYAASTQRDRLGIGAAEFFTASLNQRGHHYDADHDLDVDRCTDRSMLLICGSREAAIRQIPECEQSGIPMLTPDSSDQPGEQKSRTMLSLGRKRLAGAPSQLIEALTDTAAHLLATRPVSTVIIEGGETASALLRKLDHRQLEVVGSLARGVVAVRAIGNRDERIFIIKPGSYAWPDNLSRLFHGTGPAPEKT